MTQYHPDLVKWFAVRGYELLPQGSHASTGTRGWYTRFDAVGTRYVELDNPFESVSEPPLPGWGADPAECLYTFVASGGLLLFRPLPDPYAAHRLRLAELGVEP